VQGITYYFIDPNKTDEQGKETTEIYGGNCASPNEKVPLTIKKRNIRIQLAVRHNTGLTVRGGKNEDDKTGTLHRLDGGAPKFVYQQFIRGMNYIYERRGNKSGPIGLAGKTNTMRQQNQLNFPAKVLFNDLGRMQQHANVEANNWKGVWYSGWFIIGNLSASYQTGMQVAYVTDDPLGPVSGVVDCVVFEGNVCKVSFGPGAKSPMWDGNVQNASSTVSAGTSSPPPPEKPKTTNEYPKTQNPDNYPSSPNTPASPPSMSPSDNSSAGDRQASPADESMTIGRNPNFDDGDMTIGKNPNFDDPKKATVTSGGGGNAGMGEDTGGIKKDGESFEDFNKRLDKVKLNNALGGNGNDGPAAGVSGGKSGKGMIRTEEDVKNRDALIREVGQDEFGRSVKQKTKDGPWEDAGKSDKQSIFSGASLSRRDDEFKAKQFEPGGQKDTFREGRLPVTTGAPAQTASQEKRQKAAYNADVNSGFNPNGAKSSGQKAGIGKDITVSDREKTARKNMSESAKRNTNTTPDSVGSIGKGLFGKDSMGFTRGDGRK